MKSINNFIILSAAVLALNLHAGDYILQTPGSVIDMDSDDGRSELAELISEKTSSGDTSPILVEYKAKYSVENLQIQLPIVGDIGRLVAHIPIIGGIFGGLVRDFNPPRTLTLRALLFPAANPKGFLLGVHGLQSNARWYYKSAEDLAKKGVTSLFFDRRGSGLSDSVLGLDGKPMPGHVSNSNFDNLLEFPKDGAMGDPSEFLEDINDSYQHLYLVRDMQGSTSPIHLYANCFGARVAFAYAGSWNNPEQAFASIITTSPGTNMKKGEITTLGGKLDVINPFEHYMKIDLQDTDFTSNSKALAEMGDDSLSISLRAVTNRFLLSAGGLTQKMMAAIKSDTLSTIPTLVVIPSRDQIIYTDATEQTFANSYKGKTLVAWMNSEHMIEFDDNAQKDFVELVSQWINQENVSDTASFATQLQTQVQNGSLPTVLGDKIKSYH